MRRAWQMEMHTEGLAGNIKLGDDSMVIGVIRNKDRRSRDGEPYVEDPYRCCPFTGKIAWGHYRSI
jgi:hypothetical protein